MTVLGTGNSDAADTTTVRYPATLAAQANAVGAAVPGAVLTPDAAVQQVTLVLGSDGLSPGKTGTPADASVPPSATGAPAVDDAGGGLACIN